MTFRGWLPMCQRKSAAYSLQNRMTDISTEWGRKSSVDSDTASSQRISGRRHFRVKLPAEELMAPSKLGDGVHVKARSF
jgi:hypothetical protein